MYILRKEVVTVVPVYTVKTYGGSRDMASLILNNAGLGPLKVPAVTVI
jgi:hypothetical protein